MPSVRRPTVLMNIDARHQAHSPCHQQILKVQQFKRNLEYQLSISLNCLNQLICQLAPLLFLLVLRIDPGTMNTGKVM